KQQIQPSPDKPLPMNEFPHNLYPIPRKLAAWDHMSIPKEKQRSLERQAWSNHKQLISELEHDPYDHCICDVLGLDQSFDIVTDPDTSLDYGHRPDCLAYAQKVGNRHSAPRHTLKRRKVNP
ncbi:MAG: hypothetical protein Q9203_007664, partial [Teloschistes exilis]